MQGVIAVNESRDNINKMAEKYQEKYKECLKAQDDIDKKNRISKWRVNIGGMFCRFGLLFTSPIKRLIGNALINIGKPILKRKIDNDAKKEKEKIELEKEKISAMFIADDGSIREFFMIDEDLAKNDNINHYLDESQFQAKTR